MIRSFKIFHFSDGTFTLYGMDIIPLYDPPHLMKCVRNNMLHKDLEFDWDFNRKEEERKFAKWEHVITAFEIDAYSGNNIRHVPKLTVKHVYPDRINKMSVMMCMNVFSGKLSGRIDGLAGGPGGSTCIFLIISQSCYHLKCSKTISISVLIMFSRVQFKTKPLRFNIYENDYTTLLEQIIEIYRI